MARKKKTAAKKTAANKDSKKDTKQEQAKEPHLSTDAKKGIAIIFLFAVALVAVLSMLGVASTFGDYFTIGLNYIFGWGKALFPIILVMLALLFMFPEKYQVRKASYFGLILFVFAFFAMLHLFIEPDQIWETLKQGEGGGFVGVVLGFPFIKLMGFLASLVVLVAIIIISLIITFNASIKSLVSNGALVKLLDLFKNFFIKIKNKIVWRKYDKEFTNGEEEKPEEAEAEPPGEASEGEEETKFVKKELESASTEAPADKNGEDEEEQMALPGIKKRKSRRDITPPIDLLESKTDRPSAGDIEVCKEKIKKTLTDFGIEVEMGDVSIGPTVTQYTLAPAEGVKLSQITTLGNDLALALAAHPIRIEAPIPGKSLVGVEIPNKAVAIVGLKEAISSSEFKKRKDKSSLTVILGKDVSGKYVYADLDKMPHLLIAGATGSGKSVSINSIITSLLYENGPDDLKFVMVDPKRVELTNYNGIPHLLTPVIHDVNKTLNAFRWLISEMEKRFQLFSDAGKRDIHAFNQDASESERIPFIVTIIDELADIMTSAPRDMEALIVRLAQMARATGIHLILATQRPSVEVITGLIKANITARIAFSVASLIDSRTILDFSGAEKLLGKGDSLFISANLSKPKRIQGAYVSDEEIERMVNYLKQKAGKPDYDSEIVEKHPQGSPIGSSGGGEEEMEEDDELLSDAKAIILQADKASASLLQRRLRIGYARAARILDILEEQSFVGPADGAKPREVLADDQTYLSDDVEFDDKEEENEEPETEPLGEVSEEEESISGGDSEDEEQE